MSDSKKKKPDEGKEPEAVTAADPIPAPAADPEAEAAKIIADAEAKAAAIVAAAEAKAKADAEAKADEDQVTTKADPMEELVWYEAPLLPGVKKRDILVGVNGETLRIQRGVRVQIKLKFYEALHNAAKQEYAAFEAREEIKKQGEKALASM